MSLSHVATRSRVGLSALPVHVEIHLSPGLPTIAMVGMPESTMREARERVRSEFYPRVSVGRTVD